MNESQVQPTPQEDPSQKSKLGRAWLWPCLVLILASLVVRIFPNRLPQGQSEGPLFSWSWLIHAHQQNAFVTEAFNYFNHVIISPEDGKLWATTIPSLYSSSDEGRTWIPHRLPFEDLVTNPADLGDVTLTSISFWNRNMGWVEGTASMTDARGQNIYRFVFRTLDGGRTFHVADKALFPSTGYTNVDDFRYDHWFFDVSNGIALSPRYLEGTTNGGRSWQFLSRIEEPGEDAKQSKLEAADYKVNPGRYCRQSYFNDAGIGGWGISCNFRNEWIIEGLDAAPHKKNYLALNGGIGDLQAVNNHFAWAISEAGEFVAWTPSQTNWAVRSTINLKSFPMIAYPDKTNTPDDTPYTLDISFIDDRTGFMLLVTSINADFPEYLFQTTDGGYSWTNIAYAGAGQEVVPSDVVAWDDQNFGLTGHAMGLLKTVDGGRRWSETALPYRLYPAGWYWILCLAIIVRMGVLIRRIDTKPIVRARDVLRPDSPVQSEAEDRFNFVPIAEALARFFLNSDTMPPFTAAITGAWGSGKSSLMNLIKERLAKGRTKTVWFNAWHYQNEPSIFAALLKNVVEQAVPPIWNPRWWGFYRRLIWRRTKNRWLIASLLALWLGISWGVYHSPNRQTAVQSMQQHAKSTDITNESLPDKINGWISDFQPYLPGLSIVFSAITTALAVLKAAQGFGVKPESLLVEAGKGVSIGDLGAKVSFQLRFAEQFRDVTEAFNDKQIVIFIDDLDRCRPEKIMEILEAINFLASSGQCFIILGLSRPQVEAGLALAFRNMAAEIEMTVQEEALAAGIVPPDKKKRMAYARLYLKKLINLELRVPQVDIEKMIAKFDRKEDKDPEAEYPKWFKRLLQAWRGAKPGLPFIALILTFVVSAIVAMHTVFPNPTGSVNLQSDNQTNSPPESTTNAVSSGFFLKSTTNIVSNGESQGSNKISITNVMVAGVHEVSRPANPSNNLPADDVWNGWFQFEWGWVMLVFVAGGISFWLALKRISSQQFIDTDDFIGALKKWKEDIRKAYPTPREMVRFVNRARYLALRAKNEAPILSEWDIFANWFKRKLKIPIPGSRSSDAHKTVLNESDVVAFATYEAKVKIDPEQLSLAEAGLENDLKGRGRLGYREELKAAYQNLADEISMDISETDISTPSDNK